MTHSALGGCSPDWTRTFPIKRRERDMLKAAEMLPGQAGAATQQQTAAAKAQAEQGASMLAAAEALRTTRGPCSASRSSSG